ncbi:protein containing Coagulation factor 5/8 type [Aeoliella sp. ICT_H6.2]|uniref:Protein containing Coagulation factor 5/8 type n=1 Tax=Aeoliella straminimaris TaxID=2954799 RepID=A0A9X2F7Z3_9BACT|nr:GxGYxYP domain-containing protein [Aeoliella straminimaris]MCO6043539.1 protein containing Coagulation factor 5/8 type [Aeoliella straminimaris]
MTHSSILNSRSKLLLLLACLAFALAGHSIAESPEGITWPEGQLLPHFQTPADALDAIAVQSLTPDEQLTFAALAGHVNRKRPRIWLIQRRSEEGWDTWLETCNWKLGETFNYRNKFDLVARYAGEVRGLVLYDPSKNAHLRNMAATVAGLRKALPVTESTLERLRDQKIDLPVLEDLSQLELPTAIDVYEHLHEHYWPECEKRFLLSARPAGRGGDYHHTRDLAAACGAAAVWLDCREPAERELFEKFLADMPAGDAVMLGWYTTERSGVTTATKYGIGTMPADHFMNATVFAGGNHDVPVPEVPPTPPLENKLYVCMFYSDGDNIQYVQHAMRRIWDRTAEVRGQMPLSWTISPGLVDIAPGLLRYYRSTATPNDCLVCGPSGMGYLMPVNTLWEEGAPLGTMLDSEPRMTAYAKLTSRYLQRSGLRVVTVWDNLTEMQRRVYEHNCPSLLGVTVQNFKDDPSVRSSVVNDRLKFERLAICYCGSQEHFQRSLERRLARHDGSRPEFVSYQANVWEELQPEKLVKLAEELKRQHPQLEFVRADHYFQLQAEARGQ